MKNAEGLKSKSPLDFQKKRDTANGYLKWNYLDLINGINHGHVFLLTIVISPVHKFQQSIPFRSKGVYASTSPVSFANGILLHLL